MQIWTLFRALSILSVTSLVQLDLPFAMCCPICSPSQARHQERDVGAPSQRGLSSSPRGRAQGLLWRAGCWDRLCSLMGCLALVLGEVNAGAEGCGSSSPFPQPSGDLEAAALYCSLGGCLHPSERPPPSRGKPGKGLRGAGDPSRTRHRVAPAVGSLLRRGGSRVKFALLSRSRPRHRRPVPPAPTMFLPAEQSPGRRGEESCIVREMGDGVWEGGRKAFAGGNRYPVKSNY